MVVKKKKKIYIYIRERKKTGGKTPGRIIPKLLNKKVTFKKPLEEYEDSQSVETAEEHIKWYKFVIGNYIQLCKEGEVMSHEENKGSAADFGTGTGGGSMPTPGISTQSVTPGGAAGLGKSRETDPVKAGTVKRPKKGSSNKGTGPKSVSDSGIKVNPKKSDPQRKRASIKKPTGKSSSHIDSDTDSEEEEGDDDADNEDNFMEPEEKNYYNEFERRS